MAQHVLQRGPRVIAPLAGQLGALRRQGQAQVAAAVQRLREQLRHTARLVQRIIHQNPERFQSRHVPGQVWSLPEPHVVPSCKGKRTKPTESGCKVSVSSDRHGLVITYTAYACHIAAAETLSDALAGWRPGFGQPSRNWPGTAMPRPTGHGWARPGWPASASRARARRGIPRPTPPGSSGCNASVRIWRRCSVISTPTLAWTVVDIMGLRASSCMSAGQRWPGTPRSGAGCSTSASWPRTRRSAKRPKRVRPLLEGLLAVARFRDSAPKKHANPRISCFSMN
jgi:hypothetical protein